jgi:hypothetical protein
VVWQGGQTHSCSGTRTCAVECAALIRQRPRAGKPQVLCTGWAHLHKGDDDEGGDQQHRCHYVALPPTRECAEWQGGIAVATQTNAAKAFSDQCQTSFTQHAASQT